MLDASRDNRVQPSNDAADWTGVGVALSPEVRDVASRTTDQARDIDVSTGTSEPRTIANPIANVIAPQVGLFEQFALVQLKDELEAFMDEASAIPGMLLPRRLPPPR